MEEIWKQIPNSTYEVSNLGNVRNLGINLKQVVNTSGYYQVGIKFGGSLTNKRVGYRSVRMTHRLVAETFLGPIPEEKEVNHKDKNRLNNRLDNLEYLTRRENLLHAAPGKGKTHVAWNKGLTAETDPRVASQGWNKGEQHGKEPWNKGLTREADSRVPVAWNKGMKGGKGWEKGRSRGPSPNKGKTLSEEHRQKLKEAALRRHAGMTNEQRREATEAARRAREERRENSSKA